MDLQTITLTSIRNRMDQLGFKVFESGDYDLNLVGIRMLPGSVNAFDDLMTCFYKEQGRWVLKTWPCTTDPGTYWLEHPMRVEGTGDLVHDRQYRGCWKLGEHHAGQPDAYPCLDQSGPGVFEAWRDRNRDGIIDRTGPIYRDASGVQCHHAGFDSPVVDRWSALCQVLKRLADFTELMRCVDLQIKAGKGSTFSYTLLGWPV